MYAFTLLADRWWVMLIGRAVAGAGSPILVLGSAYISQVRHKQLRWYSEVTGKGAGTRLVPNDVCVRALPTYVPTLCWVPISQPSCVNP